MSTGIYYLDEKSGKRVEIDCLEKAERKDHVTAIRVADQKLVLLHILEVEVE